MNIRVDISTKFYVDFVDLVSDEAGKIEVHFALNGLACHPQCRFEDKFDGFCTRHDQVLIPELLLAECFGAKDTTVAVLASLGASYSHI